MRDQSDSVIGAMQLNKSDKDEKSDRLFVIFSDKIVKERTSSMIIIFICFMQSSRDGKLRGSIISRLLRPIRTRSARRSNVFHVGVLKAILGELVFDMFFLSPLSSVHRIVK